MMRGLELRLGVVIRSQICTSVHVQSLGVVSAVPVPTSVMCGNKL